MAEPICKSKLIPEILVLAFMWWYTPHCRNLMNTCLWSKWLNECVTSWNVASSARPLPAKPCPCPVWHLILLVLACSLFSLHWSKRKHLDWWHRWLISLFFPPPHSGQPDLRSPWFQLACDLILQPETQRPWASGLAPMQEADEHSTPVSTPGLATDGTRLGTRVEIILALPEELCQVYMATTPQVDAGPQLHRTKDMVSFELPLTDRAGILACS